MCERGRETADLAGLLALKKKNSSLYILAEIHVSFHDKIMYPKYINSSRFFIKYAAKSGHTEKIGIWWLGIQPVCMRYLALLTNRVS